MALNCCPDPFLRGLSRDFHFSRILMMNTANNLGALALGVALAFAGDVSSAVAATSADPVVHGSIGGVPLQSNQENARFGYFALTACDVNGDGYDDVIAGAPGYDNGSRDEGAVFVFLGGPGSFDAISDALLEGNQNGANLGTGVACSDLNGDGFDDIAAGAPGYDNGQIDEGAVLVYYGSTTGPGLIAGAVLDSGQEGANSGSRVAAAGDINGDGYNDLIVAAINYDTLHTDEGAALIYFGGIGGIDPVVDGMFDHGQWNYQLSEVAAAGDVNADGFADVMVGNWLYNGGTSGHTGTVWLLFGGPGAFDNTPDAVLSGAWGSSIGGRGRMAGGGDLNGDGVDDIALGGPRFPNDGSNPLRNKGAVLIYYGSVGSFNTGMDARVEGNQYAANLGTSVHMVADADGDGDDELLVGEPMRDSALGPNSGRVLYYKGNSGPFNIMADEIFEPEQIDSRLGSAVGSGDFNGDGVTDLLLAAPMQDDGESDEGIVFVLLR